MYVRAYREVWPYLALTVGVAAFPFVATNHYLQQVGALIGLYSIITLGLCLLIGYAGQVSLGHAAFYGLGAYTSAVLTTRLHLNPWVAMSAGVAVSVLVAYLVGRPALRLHGHHLAMATLGFGIIVQIIFHEGGDLTGGFSGIPAIPRLQVGGVVVASDRLNFYLIWLFVLVALVVSANIVNSRVGRAMRAIHDSEIAAGACGIDVARLKVKIFVLSAAFASVAGSLYVHYISFVSPDPFGLACSVQLMVMVIVGGSRSVWGALLGAALMTAVSQQIERTDAIKDLNTVVYGLALMVFVIFMPTGLAGLLRRSWDSLAARRGVASRG